MKNALLISALLSIACSTGAERTWKTALAEAKSVDLAWEDLAGPPVKKTVSGEDVKKLQRHFPVGGKDGSMLCRFHRDASLTLTDGRRIDLCFGCGIARAPDAKDTPFDKVAMRALFESLLGKQPAQKNPVQEGY